MRERPHPSTASGGLDAPFESSANGDTVRWTHPLPREGPLHRETQLIDAVRGKRAIHVGFVDEHLLETRVARGRWLQAQLAAAARELIGIDNHAAGVAWARERGYEAYVVDASSPAAVRASGSSPRGTAGASSAWPTARTGRR